MTSKRYNIDENGFLNGYGDDSWFNTAVDGTEPFSQLDYFNWRKNLATGEWVSLIVNYKYIIIPNEMIPSVVDKASLVADICFDKQFDYVLQSATVESKSGVSGQLATMTVKMTPCKVVVLTEEDKAMVQAIFIEFNTKYNPPRYLQCKFWFDSDSELNDFISSQQLNP